MCSALILGALVMTLQLQRSASLAKSYWSYFPPAGLRIPTGRQCEHRYSFRDGWRRARRKLRRRRPRNGSLAKFSPNSGPSPPSRSARRVKSTTVPSTSSDFTPVFLFRCRVHVSTRLRVCWSRGCFFVMMRLLDISGGNSHNVTHNLYHICNFPRSLYVTLVERVVTSHLSSRGYSSTYFYITLWWWTSNKVFRN